MAEQVSTGDASPIRKTLRVGVLALQGSFREHIAALRRCASQGWMSQEYTLETIEVRKTEHLIGLHGLIIPGGESTTMAHVAERNGMIPALREFSSSGAPIWGTCAGLIFLADRALGQKMGGQALLGGLNCTVHRNFFGPQINSFETNLPAPAEFAELDRTPSSSATPKEEGTATQRSGAADALQSEVAVEAADAVQTEVAVEAPFRAVFIRAPAIIETGPEVEVLSEYHIRTDKRSAAVDLPKADHVSEEEAQLDKLEKVAVAVKQGQLLATAFHPELTSDFRWHLLFLRMIVKELGGRGDVVQDGAAASEAKNQFPDPGYLPVYGSTGMLNIEMKH